MGDITDNLSRYEIACKCGCGFDTFDAVTAQVAQDTVDHFSKKYRQPLLLIVTSGNRCREHNDNLRELWEKTNGQQGAPTAEESQHIYGRALDFRLKFRGSGNQVPPDDVGRYIESRHKHISVGYYRNRNHIDSRTGPVARWGRP